MRKAQVVLLSLEDLCAEYVQVCSVGRENGTRKSELHLAISSLLSKELLRPASEIHEDSRRITDNLDVEIGMPVFRELESKEFEEYGRRLSEKLLRL